MNAIQAAEACSPLPARITWLVLEKAIVQELLHQFSDAAIDGLQMHESQAHLIAYRITDRLRSQDGRESTQSESL